MISLVSTGDFKNTEKFFKNMQSSNIEEILDRYGSKGVELLKDATPYDTGMTSSSWSYDVTLQNGKYRVNFYNNNVVDGVNIAIILQYGHGTRQGGYYEGEDYINPAIKKAFDDMVEELWREVVQA